MESLWEVWDSDTDGLIDYSEFEGAKELMDLDGNGHTSLLEVQGYLAVNNYLVCRPYRTLSLYRYKRYREDL